MDFKGYQSKETLTAIPDAFFRELVGKIDDLAELKVTAVSLWHLTNQSGPDRWLRHSDLSADLLGLSDQEKIAALERAVERGSLLAAGEGARRRYYLNSPQGRAALTRAAQAAAGDVEARDVPPLERPNIFQLYEDNIGPLTPLIAEALKDAQATYSEAWVSDAIGEAARYNRRSLRYIEAVLKRWKDEGRAQKQNRRDAEKDGWEDLDRRIAELRRRSQQ